MTLPAEKLTELRQLIHNHIATLDLQDEIRGCISTQKGKVDEQSLMRALEEKGIVDQVMQSLNLSKGNCVKTPSKAQPVVDKTEETHEGECLTSLGLPCFHSFVLLTVAVTGTIIQPNKRYVFLQVLGGKAFLDHLQESESSLQQFFILHVHFRGQRLCSKPIPCSCEPAFHEGFPSRAQQGTPRCGQATFVHGPPLCIGPHPSDPRTQHTHGGPRAGGHMLPRVEGGARPGHG